MSEVHKAILKRANACVAAGNYDGFLDYCTEDTEWNFVGGTVLKGKNAVRKWMDENYLTPPKVTVEHMVSEGDMLIATGKVTVQDVQGNSTTSSYCDVWRFGNGLLVELNAYVISDKTI